MRNDGIYMDNDGYDGFILRKIIYTSIYLYSYIRIYIYTYINIWRFE